MIKKQSDKQYTWTEYYNNSKCFCDFFKINLH